MSDLPHPPDPRVLNIGEAKALVGMTAKDILDVLWLHVHAGIRPELVVRLETALALISDAPAPMSMIDTDEITKS